MKASSFLLDTNIIIPVEDARKSPEIYSKLLHDIQAHGHQAWIHQANVDDIARDRDKDRREISLSKVRRYPKVELSWRDRDGLVTAFGDIRSDNDLSDCHLLAALRDGVVDFLVTEDNGLHTRARRSELDSKVLYVRQALDLINAPYANVEYNLNSIQTVYCYQLDPQDEIFESLRGDYSGFDLWLEACRQKHRRAWVARDGGAVAGLVIFKDETRAEAPSSVDGERVLKLCTFKISESYRGGRLGEQMLRQATCYAFDNSYDAIYLTAFAKQTSLMAMLEYYGFVHVGTEQNDELVYAKTWNRSTAPAATFDGLRIAYPQLPSRFNSGVIVPIKPKYHDRLFPEAATRLPGVTRDLFAGIWSQGTPEETIPSNSIRKAYLSNARLNTVPSASLICFYRSQDHRNRIESGITAVGVSEAYDIVSDYSVATQLIAKRSVYSPEEIALMMAQWGHVKILRFMFYGYLDEPIFLDEVIEMGLVNGPPQSFARVPQHALDGLLERVKAAFVAG